MNTQFSIIAKTCALKYNSQEGKSTILKDGIEYVVPIYQRPYSWKEEHLSKFISDIFSSYWGNDEDVKNIVEEPMFIGTMQLSAIKNNKHEVIDGQQRITTLLLLFKALKYKYPACEELNSINFKILKTEVNSGEQQKHLDFVLEGDIAEVEDTQNKYLENLRIIQTTISSTINDYEGIFDIDRFVKYLLGSIYFVVIETNAGLSKTLQIFNAINTTGLDLNGGDLFKIRMYEYLTDEKKEDKSVFDKISELYQKIDQKNAQLKWDSDIRGVLSIYQYVIIAKYELPTTLYYLGVETFFERLFDTILNINQWEHFKNNVKKVELSLEDIDKIIDLRYEWERKWKSKEGFTAEYVCAVNLIWWSRYSRYWNLIFVHLFINAETEDSWDKMFLFTKQLNKLFFIYSVRFQKVKNKIYYTLMHNVISTLVNGSFDDTMRTINEAIANQEDHNREPYKLETLLCDNLTENAKRKNLICRLSAMLDEEYETSDTKKTEAIEKKLFLSSLDIEHIQSSQDENEENREDIIKEWGKEINSIGNLMVLEYEINRSISNNNYGVKLCVDREKSYLTSELKIVKNHVLLYPKEKGWGLTECVKRKEAEKEKILKYLFRKYSKVKDHN